MMLYNVTVGIDQTIEAEWVPWMKEVHIPAVLATGMFLHAKMYKVLHDNPDGSISYSVQYFANSIVEIQAYLEQHAPRLVEAHKQKFRDKHVAFRTVLEEV
jgi:hypothetical protein